MKDVLNGNETQGIESALTAEDRKHQSRLWRVLGAATATVLSFGVGLAATDAGSVHIDEARSPTQLSDVVKEIERACRSGDRVNVDVKLPHGSFSSELACRNAQVDPDAAIVKPLLARASRYNHAGAKANRVIAVQESLPPTPGLNYDHDQMVWLFAAGQPQACQRADSQSQIRQDLAIGAQVNGETPEHWTLVEAVLDAGACPEKVPHLFRNVAAIGQSAAADTVMALIQAAGR